MRRRSRPVQLRANDEPIEGHSSEDTSRDPSSSSTVAQRSSSFLDWLTRCYLLLAFAGIAAMIRFASRRPWRRYESQQIPTYQGGGFLLFSLQMGRYGNQMETALGVLAEAKRRCPSRYLVLPSFISWHSGPGSTNEYIPFDSVFDVEALREYHRDRIITFVEFKPMVEVEAYRIPFDFSRASVYCPAKFRDRKPFPHYQCLSPDMAQEGSYWRALGIRLTDEQWYEEESLYDLDPTDHPVILSNGAPGALFPMKKENYHVAKYLKWSSIMKRRRSDLLSSSGIREGEDSMVATHLRAGSDWVKACQHGVGRPQYMASPQCGSTMVTEELCLPTANMTGVSEMMRDVAVHVRGATKNTNSKRRLVLFVASDVAGLGERLMTDYALNDTYDLLLEQPHNYDHAHPSSAIENDAPLLDLILMTHADYFVGNCVSSFTSFAARIRMQQGFGMATKFFGINKLYLGVEQN